MPELQNIEYTPLTGLTDAQVEHCRKNGLTNATDTNNKKSAVQILSSNLFTLFNLINLLLAAALVAAGSWRNTLFMGAVLCNALVGTVQEFRARSALKKLHILNTVNVCAVRDGAKVMLSPDQLVRGDIITLKAGDQIPADAIIRQGTGTVNESLITGESDDLHHGEGDLLFSGSYITSGSYTLQLVRVGSESYASSITAHAAKLNAPRSRLLEEMQRMVRIITILMLPLGLILFCKQYLIAKEPIEPSLSSAAGAMIGMIPNGLILLVSLALTVGVLRLAKKNVLVQNIYGVEALARANMLCLDKTGTLTTGEMTVSELVPFGNYSEADMTSALADLIGAIPERNNTTAAIERMITPIVSKPVDYIPFSSARKYSAVELSKGSILILGAPSFVCSNIPSCVSEKIESYTISGCRVLILCRACSGLSETMCPGPHTILGLIIIEDVLRPTAKDTLREFVENGVSLRVISGDDPAAVSVIARRLEIPGAENALDVSAISDDSALASIASRYTVFGRVTPQRKRVLIEALRSAGFNVAMTGDGVNDIPAMKAADCSVAMVGGSSAARHAATVTLLDNDFSSLPAIVFEGRRVVNNVTRSASLFLMKTLYSLLLSLIFAVLPASYPFKPIQLTLIAALTIGAPAFLLALEKNCDPINGSFLTTVLSNAFPGAIAVSISACAFSLLSRCGWSWEVYSSAAATAAAFCGICMLFRVCVPFTRFRLRVSVLFSFLITFMVICFGKWFMIDFSLMTTASLPALICACLLCVLCSLIPARIFRRVFRFLEK